MTILNTLSDKKLVDLLRSGAIGVLPTDTVYGLTCWAADEVAVSRLYDFKKREHKPGTIIAANIEQLVELGIKERYLKPVTQYWPNPISIVIPCADLAYLHLGQGSLAVRIPDDTSLSALLLATGPLLTTSANHSGELPANTTAEAQNYFGNTVDFYVDGGDLSNREPSTIIRIIDDEIEVLREGAIKFNEKGEMI